MHAGMIANKQWVRKYGWSTNVRSGSVSGPSFLPIGDSIRVRRGAPLIRMACEWGECDLLQSCVMRIPIRTWTGLSND